MKLRISVTKEILEKSKNCYGEGSAHNCAIALAIRDIFPHAAVYSDSISFFNLCGGPFIRTQLPCNAQSFINEFDYSIPTERSKMNPISFEIDIPEYVISNINISEVTELLNNHPTLSIID